MYYYNFVTREVSHILDPIKWFVLGSNADVKFEVSKNELSIVDLFGRYLVAYPVKALGAVLINSVYDSGETGKLTVKCSYGKRTCHFSIHDDILYLSFQ